MTFRAYSLDALPEGPAFVGGPFLRTIVVVDLASREAPDVDDVIELYQRTTRDVLLAHGGTEIDAADGLLALFDLPSAAVRFAEAHHAALEHLSAERGVGIFARIALHLGEVYLKPNAPQAIALGAKAAELDGLARNIASNVRSVARPRQTLLTRSAFDIARCSTDVSADLLWLAHGSYLIDGLEEPVDLFEVGAAQRAPLTAPPDSSIARRSVAAEDEATLGWRAGTGQPLPWKPSWVLDRKLGDGGVGEVWLMVHETTGEPRVIKFCYRAERVRSLKREVALLRLLRDALGHREDIVPVLGWDFEASPPHIETAYSPEGSLPQWAEKLGGLPKIPRSTRLRLMAEAADALAAAHSVGVVHKDVKPSNVLIKKGEDGQPRVILSDFGIGQLSDRSVLDRYRVTLLGTTDLVTPGSDSSGTMMYLAPELLEKRTPTIHSDIYSLGVMLYQTVVGDFSRALSTSWRRDIDDDLLADDIAQIVDGAPERRPASASEVAGLLRSLEARRAQREADRQARERVEGERRALERIRIRRRRMGGALVALSVFSAALAWQVRQTKIQAHRAEQEALRASRQAKVAERVTNYLVDLLNESDPVFSKGQARTVTDVFLDARARLDEVGEDPVVNARVKQVIAVVLTGQGQFDEAIALLKASVALYKATLGPDALRVADALVDLAMAHMNRGQQDEAAGAASRARQILTARGERANERHVAALQVLAQVAFDAERMREAQDLFEEAYAIERANDASPRTLRGLEERIALCRLNLGDRGGLEELRRSYAWRRENLGADDLETAQVLTHLSFWLLKLGDLSGAAQGYSEAVRVYERIFGPEHPYVATILGNLGWVRVKEERAEDAEPLLRRAVALSRAGWGKDNWRTGVNESRLGWALFRLGHIEEAEVLLIAAERTLCTQLAETTSGCRDARDRLERSRARLTGPSSPALEND